MAATKATNLSRLEAAGLVHPKKLSAAHKRRLTKLTRAEVNTLIRVKEKLKFSGQLHKARGKVEPDTFV
jgi:hypothetical protein